jgi:hypothetical protein
MLERYLQKLGVGSYSQLTEEEKVTYREYEEILNGRQITDKDVKSFLDMQLENTTKALISSKLDTREDTFLKVKLEFLRNIVSFLEAPEREKEQLQNLINN